MSMMAEPDELTCSLCLGEFENPKIIPCFHTFCCECLHAHISRNQHNGYFICPICRKVSATPDAGAKGFQANFYITKRPPAPIPKPVKEGPNMSADGENCTLHQGERIILFCYQCKLTCCRDCKIEFHDEHRSSKLSDMFEKRIPDAKWLIAEAEVKKEEMQQYETAVIAKLDEAASDEMRLKTCIEQRHEEMTMKLEARTKQALKNLKDISSTAVGRIQEVYKSLQDKGKFLTQSVNNLNSSIASKDAGTLVQAINDEKKSITKTVTKVDIKDLYLGIEVETPLLSVDEHVTDLIGKITMTRTSRSLRTELKLLKEQNFSVDKKGFFESFIGIGLSSKTILVVSDTEAWLAMRGTYQIERSTVLRKINMSGDILTSIPVNGSVNSIAAFDDGLIVVSQPYEDTLAVIGQDVTHLAKVKKPTGIATFENEVYVCSINSSNLSNVNECDSNRVLVLTREGVVIRSIEFNGGTRLFNHPGQIAVNYNGDICVSDLGKGSLLVLSNKGTLKYEYSGLGDGGYFKCGNILCDEPGYIMVKCNMGLDVLNSRGNFLWRYPNMDGVMTMGLGPRGRLWLAMANSSIKVMQYTEYDD